LGFVSGVIGLRSARGEFSMETWLRGGFPRSHASSEAQLGCELELEWIVRIARRIESQDRIRRQAEIGLSVEGVKVFDVGAVEQVEHVAAQLGLQAFAQMKYARHPHIKAGVSRPVQRVAAQISRTVRERVAVTVGIRAGKNIEGLSAFH